ncbi:MAG: hypothetical protein IIB17_05730 [Chloroflexi bacterium]|nr:hypothetical protein [Chloroflexota bacterium]
MYIRGSRFAARAIPFGVIIASAVIAFGAWIAVGDEFPVGALIIISVAGGAGTMWGLFNLNYWNNGGAGLEWLYTLGTRPRSTTTINIVKADGVCPRGFNVDDTIEIGADGRLSNPMCRAAIEALRPAVLSKRDSPYFQAMARCDCAVADTNLTFATIASEYVNHS